MRIHVWSITSPSLVMSPTATGPARTASPFQKAFITQRAGPGAGAASGTICGQCSRTANTRKRNATSTAISVTGKNGSALLVQHRDQRVDRARQHRRRDDVLARPHDLRRDPGEEVDEHPTRGGGDQPDDDRGEDPKAVIERLMRAQDRKPGQRERLEEGQRPRAEPLLLRLERSDRSPAPANPSEGTREDRSGL